MIELRSVSKIYGKKHSAFKALNDVSLKIPKGSVVAIIGKSGSGKSTLMHTMSGLDRPTVGQVVIANKNLSKTKDKDIDKFRAQTIGFIFQSFFVEPKQTCFQNIALPLEIKGVARGKRKAMIEEALINVGLKSKIYEKAGNLSGGEKQRLAIARAIVNKPDYIFADEPTGNLDTANGEKIVDLLFGLNKNLGSTLAIVTHDQDLADKCQYKIFMQDGEITSNDINNAAQPGKKSGVKS